MAYTTPVTDRTISDIINKTAKGYFNKADWTRIYGNSGELNSLIDTKLGDTITFNSVTVPDIDGAPEDILDLLNTTLANITRMRTELLASFLLDITGALDITDDWVAGDTEISPDYTDVNEWEETIDIMYNAVTDATLQEFNIADESDNLIIDESGNFLTQELWSS